MLPRDSYGLLHELACQLGRSYTYETVQKIPGTETDYVFSFVGQTQKTYLSFSKDFSANNLNDFKPHLEFVRKQAADNVSAQLILPITWSCDTKNQVFLENKITGIGLLILSSQQTASWIGMIPSKLSEQLSSVLVQLDVRLIENYDSLNLTTDFHAVSAHDLPVDFRDFVNELRLQIRLREAAFSNARFGNFLQTRWFKIKGEPEPILIRSVMDVLPTLEGHLEFSAEKLLFNLQDISLPVLLSSALEKVAACRHPDKIVSEIREFSEISFSYAFSLLLSHEDFITGCYKKSSKTNGYFVVMANVASQLAYEMIYPRLAQKQGEDTHDARVEARILKDISKNLLRGLEAMNGLLMLKPRFYSVHKQLLGFIAEYQQNTDALTNISNFLSLVFQKNLRVNPSSEEVIAFLNDCFFEWSDVLESFFPGIDSSLEEALVLSRSFFENIANPVSPLSKTLTFVVGFLDRLTVELSGLDKDHEWFSEHLSHFSLQKEYRASCSHEAAQYPEENYFLDISCGIKDISEYEDGDDLDGGMIAVHAPTPLVGSSTVLQKRPCDEILLDDPESSFFDDTQNDGSLDWGIVPVTKTGACSGLVFETLIHVVDTIPDQVGTVAAVEPAAGEAGGYIVPPETLSSATASTPTPTNHATVTQERKPELQQSIPWYRVALGLVGLALVTLGVAGLVIATHGAGAAGAAAAMPWLAHAVIDPLIAYAGLGGVLGITSVAVAVGVGAVVTTTHPTAWQKVTGFCRSFWSKGSRKSHDNTAGLSATGSPVDTQAILSGTKRAATQALDQAVLTVPTPQGRSHVGNRIVGAAPILGEQKNAAVSFMRPQRVVGCSS